LGEREKSRNQCKIWESRMRHSNVTSIHEY
jgi:hypothetical protein